MTLQHANAAHDGFRLLLVVDLLIVQQPLQPEAGCQLRADALVLQQQRAGESGEIAINRFLIKLRYRNRGAFCQMR